MDEPRDQHGEATPMVSRSRWKIAEHVREVLRNGKPLTNREIRNQIEPRDNVDARIFPDKMDRGYDTFSGFQLCCSMLRSLPMPNRTLFDAEMQSGNDGNDNKL
ncbi:uncharacterized protein LOC129718497 [Wyeomyia smithii]|uniref:uncharacterized protein LOC129718497 n=1 Tax=Wyeomyia smithii TaxID=174621 RepID=UPI002467D069|nr:uncharacterized protein LOC129718497 [Wyeomyia smithii]